MLPGAIQEDRGREERASSSRNRNWLSNQKYRRSMELSNFNTTQRNEPFACLETPNVARLRKVIGNRSRSCTGYQASLEAIEGWKEETGNDDNGNCETQADSDAPFPCIGVIDRSVEQGHRVRPGKRPSSADSNMSRDSSYGNKQKQKPSSMKVFCENVSISGLRDAYEARTTPEKVMWYLAFVATLLGMVVTGFHVGIHYLQQPLIYNDMETMGYMGPFPNVTICAPFAFDREKVRGMLVIPQKIDRLIGKLKLDKEEIIKETVDAWGSLSTFPNKTVAYIITTILDETIYTRIMFHNRSEMDHVCEEILSNCYFNNIPFKCCQSARRVFFEKTICYHISFDHNPEFRNVTVAIGGATSDVGRMETSGFVVNISVNLTKIDYEDGVAMDGFHIHIGPMASPLSDPISIPSNMDAIIAMKPPVLRKELKRCRPNVNIPHVPYLEYYDPYGVRCMGATFIGFVDSFIGCVFDGLDYYVPLDERKCKRELMYTMKSIVEGNQEMMKGTFRQNMDASLESKLRNGSCLPLCTRWTYDVLSSSYGSVRYRDDPMETEERRNRSVTWSRVRIYFPSVSSRVHSEQTFASIYFIFCKIGGALAGYAGISVITFAEITAYAMLGLCLSKRIIVAKRRLKETMSGNRVDIEN